MCKSVPSHVVGGLAGLGGGVGVDEEPDDGKDIRSGPFVDEALI